MSTTATATTDAESSYSVPAEARKLFLDGIVANPLHSSAPPELAEAAQEVHYEGSDLPSLPIPWRFAESIAAIKGFQAAMLGVLLKRKEGRAFGRVVINTDHAQLFIMSTTLTQVLSPTTGEPLGSLLDPATAAKVAVHFPPADLHRAFSTWHRRAATNIYRTADDKYYHIHGSMNPDVTLAALGLPLDIDPPAASLADAVLPIAAAVAKHTAADLDTLMNDTHRQAGTICLTAAEYAASPHGVANAHVGLYELHAHPSANQPPTWWSTPSPASPARPLAGLKVLDLSRVIAAPTLSRELAELGASVLRITAPHITDMDVLHPDLNWGKWNAHLDLRTPDARARLRALIADADVVVDGYRPGVMAKHGFSRDDIFAICAGRTRGVVYVRENCYGWHGPLQNRSGWQQLSDASTGVSHAFGAAMGHAAPVTPVFPNSDYCTGAAGATGVLEALAARGTAGGSYSLDIALNYYSRWLTDSCGQYPAPVWAHLYRTTHGAPVYSHDDNMLTLMPAVLGLVKGNPETARRLFRPDFFEVRETPAAGTKVRCVKPVCRWVGGEVETGFTVGARGNGVDEPRWPEDLGVQVVGVDN
ncbi:CAIB/BAIF family enzyme [Geopyxis carbonaria]|nr:CAIB/BAIF family enzyme [Geopyxis carbonaria]